MGRIIGLRTLTGKVPLIEGVREMLEKNLKKKRVSMTLSIGGSTEGN